MCAEKSRLSYTELVERWPKAADSAIAAYRRRAVLRSHLSQTERPVVCVFDDDPTGIQTVHDVTVFLRWSAEAIIEAFRSSDLFYIQTNSRGKPAAVAAQINREIFALCANASRLTDRPFRVVSRSDSTLRGHYPLETDILREEWRRFSGREPDGEILIPFFLEGGRLTVSDVHYVREEDSLTPAAETEFARDRVFGYSSSNLRAYIEEKTGGRICRDDVLSIGLDLMRAGNLAAIESLLMSAERSRRIIVNAIEYDDLRIFVEALMRAEQKGKLFLFRSAASFVKVYGFVDDRPLLAGADFAQGGVAAPAGAGRGILVLVGSHVQKSTRQLEQLISAGGVEPVELDVPRILFSEGERRNEIRRAAELADTLLSQGRDAIVYTSRKLATADLSDGDLSVSALVSASLSAVARAVSVRPAAVVAKGGITSSDVATEGLAMERALVLGQIVPGVPVVRAGPECRWPDIPYIIFPGNVGGDTALRDACRIVRNGVAR